MLCHQLPDNAWNMPSRCQSVFWGVIGGIVSLATILAISVL